MDELGQHERSLLLALQQEDTPGAADAERIRRRVLMAAGAAGTVGVAATATSLAGATTAQTGASVAGLTAGVWKAVLVVGATVGVGSGAYAVSQMGAAEPPEPATLTATYDERTQATEDEVLAADPAEQARPAAVPDETPPPSAASAPDVDHAPKVAISARKAAPESKPERVSSSVDTLKEEAALLSSAQQALRQGDPQGAIAALTLHKEKFPRGVLSGERQAALAVAYCQSGSLEQGREGASLFIKNNPKSPMVQRLKAACKLP